LRMQNTMQNIVKHHSWTGNYNKSGIYQRKCLDCPLKYTGQTGRAFRTTYKEYIQGIRNNNSNAEYSNHILNTGYKYGITTDIMDIMRSMKRENTSTH
jgi:hypothetical protein